MAYKWAFELKDWAVIYCFVLFLAVLGVGRAAIFTMVLAFGIELSYRLWQAISHE